MCNAIISPDKLEKEHRGRLLQALGMVAADKGFAATTIADIVRQAGMSKRTFYEHFNSKEACFLALYRAVSASALRTLRDALKPDRSWHSELETALNAYFAHLSTGPRLLRTLFVEVHQLGEPGAAVRREVMQQLADFVRQVVHKPGLDGASGRVLSPTMAMAAVGGINELVLQAIETRQDLDLTRLTAAASAVIRALALGEAASRSPDMP
ncbi:MAG: TetR/AcrR family transcriptional regulator [Hydrogenophaga sp.]|nr:TetR/AcrR family transcriptional regulator [Hydrogenophaga sp.]